MLLSVTLPYIPSKACRLEASAENEEKEMFFSKTISVLTQAAQIISGYLKYSDHKEQFLDPLLYNVYFIYYLIIHLLYNI